MSRSSPRFWSLSTVALVLLIGACAPDQEVPTAPQTELLGPISETASAVIAADRLEAEIEALMADGSLNRGQGTALLKKLESAERHAAAGRTTPAMASLDALIQQVEDFVDEGILTPVQGDVLVEATEDVRQVIGGGFASVAAGSGHSCAVGGTGDVFCWGDNSHGQLGDGTTTSSLVPVQVASSESFVTVSAGPAHTCALSADGDAFCWGRNADGELGDGTTDSRSSPVPVSGGITFASLDAGHLYSCGISDGGVAYCWGTDQQEQLGAASEENCATGSCSTVPLAVSSGFVQVSTGLFATCGIDGSGAASCWGRNLGQFGNGVSSGLAVSPVPAFGSVSLEEIAVGTVVTCGLEPDGDALCSGVNVMGQLGTGTSGSATSTSSPVTVSGGLTFESLDTSSGNTFLTHACGVTTGNDAYCWGANDAGQLGASSTETCAFAGMDIPCSSTPLLVTGGLSFAAIDLGGVGDNGTHTCGITTDGDVYCWGDNGSGQVGDGSTVDRTDPTLVSFP